MMDFLDHKCRRPWRWALVLGTAAFLLMILMGPIQETGDDAMTTWQLSRGAGVLSSFVGAPLSLLLSFLYEWFPQLPWWSLVLVFSAWVLLTVGFWLLLDRYKGLDFVGTSAILLFAVWTGVLEQVNFTRSAAAYALAGIFMITQALWKEEFSSKERKLYYLLGSFLVLMGGQVRYRAALLSTPYLMAAVLYRACCENGIHPSLLFKKKTVKKIMAAALSALMIFAVQKAGVLYSRTQPGWTEWKAVDSQRSAIMDYREDYPSWDEGAEEYLAIGFIEEDIDLMFQYICFADTEVITAEKLEQMVGLRRSNATQEELFASGLAEIKNTLRTGKLFWVAAASAAALTLCIGLKALLPYAVCSAGTLAILAYMGLYVRRINLRVWDSVCLCLVGVLLVCLRSLPQKKHFLLKLSLKGIAGVILAAAALNFGVHGYLLSLSVPTAAVDRDNHIRQRADYINSTPDRLYLYTRTLIHHIPAPSFLGFWEPVPEGYCDNYFPLGNWDARTPYQMQRYAELGIENPVRALVDRMDVYSDVNDVMLDYLQAHYGEDITSSAVDWYEDGSPIVQYSRNIDLAGMPREEIELQVTEAYFKVMYGYDAWIFNGTAGEDLNEYEAVWCSMETESGPRTWRLGVSDAGGFESVLYDLSEEFGNQDPAVTLIALEKSGEYKILGTVSLTGLR